MNETETRAAESPKLRLWAARVIVAAVFIFITVLIGFKIYSHKKLQAPLDTIFEEAGATPLKVTARFEKLFQTKTLVFDVRVFGEPGAGILLRCFYEFAAAQKNSAYREVKIAYRGRVVLKIDGGTFQALGKDFGMTDMASLNRRFALAAQLPGGKRVMDLDHRILERLLRAAAKRTRGR